ncbi:MAG: DUF445 domain-containing protein [Bergeyella sp.]
MNDLEKKKQLRKYKAFATGLFVLMAVIFIITTVMQKTNDSHWIGYVRAFSEAAMVGALADWFAVTALFHYPLGLKIPHTNLIQNSKERIGDNLGNFVVENFLSPQNIRPYILKLKISVFVGEWLSKNKNQEVLINETSEIVLNILRKLDDESVVRFISRKAGEMTSELNISQIVGSGLEYVVEKNEHQKLITNLSKQIKEYVLQNHEMVRERVKKESFTLIPKFVDDAIADKITKGLSNYFEEVEQDENHSLRSEITQKLELFASELKTENRWKEDFQNLKNNFLQEEKLNSYASDIWDSIKKTITEELSKEDSPVKNYIRRNLNELSQNLQNDEQLQYKIDHWIRVTAYKYILKNTHQFGSLISSTVGNWEGKELSRKLELEVGKDLQFIRVNGTLVGSLVGLVIYTIANFFI